MTAFEDVPLWDAHHPDTMTDPTFASCACPPCRTCWTCHNNECLREGPAMTRQRIWGHELLAEGAAFDAMGGRVRYNTVSGYGHARCACGAASDVLRSSNMRKEWHREHKAEMLSRAKGATA